MLARLLPAVCDVSVTNVCNAACDCCGFARDKTPVGPRRYIDPDAFAQALPILHQRGIRWRCAARNEPLDLVFDFDHIAEQRDVCNNCMIACYGDAGVAAVKVAQARSAADSAAAVASLFRRSVVLSLWALIEQAPQTRRRARRGRTRMGSRKPSDDVTDRMVATKVPPRKPGDTCTGGIR